MAQRYHVILEKEVASGADAQTVEQRLSVLLKTDIQKISALRTGAPSFIRKSVDLTTAEKYRAAFEKAGANCRIEPAGVSDEEAGGHAAESGGPSTADSPSVAAVMETLAVSHTYQGGDMYITNIETVPGKTVVAHFGLVSGSTIRAKHIGRDFMAGLKNLVGGELKGYTQLLQESRRQAMERMIAQAEQLGANAIVNVRFSTSSVAQGAAELYAYGTAVQVK